MTKRHVRPRHRRARPTTMAAALPQLRAAAPVLSVLMAPTRRETLRSEIQAVDAHALLPHHRRGALIMVAAELDILDVAVAVADDDAGEVAQLIERGGLRRPSLGELADWLVDDQVRFQFCIVQPYVLAQLLPGPG